MDPESKVIAGVAIIAVVAIPLVFLFTKSVVAPASMAIDNQVFHESAQYTDGMIRQLDELRRDYFKAQSEGEKDAILATIRHQFAPYPMDKLPPDLRLFMTNVRGY